MNTDKPEPASIASQSNRSNIIATLSAIFGGPPDHEALTRAGDYIQELVGAARTEGQEELSVARSSREHTEYWYAVRFERLKAYAREHGFWHDMAAIIANGQLGGLDADGKPYPYEPPTYEQQINMATWRAKQAEALLIIMARALGERPLIRHAEDCAMVGSASLCTCGLSELHRVLERAREIAHLSALEQARQTRLADAPDTTGS
jgi:hypothetical protein